MKRYGITNKRHLGRICPGCGYDEDYDKATRSRERQLSRREIEGELEQYYETQSSETPQEDSL